MTPKQMKIVMLGIVSDAITSKNSGINKKTIQSNIVFSLENVGVEMVNALFVGENIVKEIYKQTDPTALSICQALWPVKKS